MKEMEEGTVCSNRRYRREMGTQF